MKFFTAVIILLLSFSYGNAENCKPNKINFDICKKAKKIQKEVAPNLPQKLSRNMSLVNVMSNGPEVSLTAQLTYTRNFLEKNVKAAGQTMSQIDAKMQSFTRKYLCSNKVTKSFIKLGGRVVMNFRDGENAFKIAVDRC